MERGAKQKNHDASIGVDELHSLIARFKEVAGIVGQHEFRPVLL